MQRVVVVLSDNEYEALRRAAFEEHMSMSELVRRAVDRQLGTVHDEIEGPGRRRAQDRQ
jgi:hypothetical protein